jgi:hypothetical protein
VTFVFALSGNAVHITRTTVNVTCPPRHIQRSDRTCRDVGPIPADLIVPAAHRPDRQKIYQVGLAALAGMLQAAEEMKDQFGAGCSAIPEQYRLNRNLLVALLVSINHHELHQDISRSDPQPISLMDLSRGDYYHKNIAWRHQKIHLYSLKSYDYNSPSDYPNAFWHPGVGLWQLDDANKFGSLLNHAERAQAVTAAKNAARILHENYCLKKDGPRAQFADRLAWSLLDDAWVACSDTVDGEPVAANCVPTLDDIVSGDDVFADTRSVQSVSPYAGRLYLNAHPDLVHEYGGGVEPLTCRWTGSRRYEKPFRCHMYDVGSAEGYMWLSDDASGTDPGNDPEDAQRSPLAAPFLSFTDMMSNPAVKYIVFKSSDTGYGRDLIAAVSVGTNVRTDPETSRDPDYGWWYEDEKDGSGVEIVPES